MTFAEDFLIQRRRAGLNQTDAARLLDIGVRTLYSWEQGDVVPHPLMRIGALFKLSGAAVERPKGDVVKLWPLGGPGPASERVITPETLEEPLRPSKGIDWSSVDWTRPPFEIATELGTSVQNVIAHAPKP